MSDQRDLRRTFGLPPQAWVAIGTVVLSLGTPALIWAGKVDGRVENLEKRENQTRSEIREDLRQINDKLDKLKDQLVAK